jgi:hypothetical protein
VTFSEPQMVLNSKPSDGRKDPSKTKDQPKNAAPNAPDQKADAAKNLKDDPGRKAPPPDAELPPPPPQPQKPD